ncbi:MAG TPA: FHA domain-containing protein [Actinomycetota bacterium]
MFCTNCGHPNADDAKFCARCGVALQDDTTISFTPVEEEEDAARDQASPYGDLEPGQALLAVKRGANAGSTFLLDKDVTTAGRMPDSDIFLDDVTVSRKHAELRREDNRFFVHDSGSLNGTYVNMQRVDDAELASGDEIQIGKFKLAFFVGE